MIEVAQTYLGNINHNSQLNELIKQERYLKVLLQQSDRNKGRIHAHSTCGVTVGIIKSRDRSLENGDLFRSDCDQLILIQLQASELMILDLASLKNINAVQLVSLGHVLGNHHYPITIHDQKIYIQLTTDKLILEKLIHDLAIADLQISYNDSLPDPELAFMTHQHH